MVPVLHIVGARPQFVKAAVVLDGTCEKIQQVVHTGQHYDSMMSDVFFDELNIRRPRFNLGVGSGTHGAQTAAMMVGLEDIMCTMKTGVAVLYGDTNSTLAGGLVATKMGWSVLHVEAGLRSHDRRMPEELNRIAVDHLSDRLLCPTQTAMEQLEKEGLGTRAFLTGDVMFDAALSAAERAKTQSPWGRFFAGQGPLPGDHPLPIQEIRSGQYALATLHRAGNTDDPHRLMTLISALGRMSCPVLLPVHPRTRHALQRADLTASGSLHFMDPVGYLDFAALIKHSQHVVTDSGGVQKEAIFHERPCTTMRDTTEWPETLTNGWNVLVDACADALIQAVERPVPSAPAPTAEFGGGQAGALIQTHIEDALQAHR